MRTEFVSMNQDGARAWKRTLNRLPFGWKRTLQRLPFRQERSRNQRPPLVPTPERLPFGWERGREQAELPHQHHLPGQLLSAGDHHVPVHTARKTA